MRGSIAAIPLLAVFAVLPLSAQTITSRAADIRFGGRLHTQYAASSVESADNDFFFRRARLIADIRVSDFLGARLQTDFSGGEAQIQDAYVTLGFSPSFDLSIGQFKRAFDLFELSSSTDLSLIERDGRVEGAGSCAGVGGVCSYSRLTEKLGFAGRDQGIRAEGQSGRVGWMATLTNGTGINVSDVNDAKSVSGRLTLAATDRVSLGAQVAVQDYVDPADESAYSPAFGVDVDYGAWRDGLHVQAAFVAGDNWRSLDPAGDAPGFRTAQAVASWYVPSAGDRMSGWEPLVRLSWADPDGDTDDDGAVVFTPGFMVYVMGRNKIGLNLDVFSPQTGGTEYSLKVQSFLYF